METHVKRQRNYSSIGLGAVLVMAFVMIQPTVQTANAVDGEAFPTYDNCGLVDTNHTLFGDVIAQNTVKKGNIVKTIHAEKEIFICSLDQGNIPVVVEVTTYMELYENIAKREVIATSSLVASCIKDITTATLIGCEAYVPSTSPVPVGSNCVPLGALALQTSPQEMDSVRSGDIVKTIETQKNVYQCFLSGPTQKKVDMLIITEIYENITTHEVIDVQFHEMRCIVLVTDSSDDRQDGRVESCVFKDVATESPF